MKVALPWPTEEEVKEYTDEYNITLRNKPESFNKLIDFLQDHQQYRFNLTIENNEIYGDNFDLEKLKILNAIHPNLYICTHFETREFLKLREMGLKYYFSASAAANSFRLLEELVKFGTTDVYIIDDLCYCLADVRKFCDKNNVRIRMILNRIPSVKENKGQDLKSPYFVPEVVDELAKYIDVVEFDVESWIQYKTLYKIWFEKKQWKENLTAINRDLEIDIYNQSLIPDFIIFKMNCKYRCAYRSICHKCIQFKDISDDLYKKHIEYIVEKE